MHLVAAARPLGLCGTEKCPSEFATDRASAVSGISRKVVLFWSFSTALRSISAKSVPYVPASSSAISSARWLSSKSKTRSNLSLRHLSRRTPAKRRSEALCGGAE